MAAIKNVHHRDSEPPHDAWPKATLILRDDGIAMLWAIIMMIVIAGFAMVILGSSILTSHSTRDQLRDIQADPPMRSAMSAVLTGLRTNEIRESLRYVIDPARVIAFADPGASPIATMDAAIPAGSALHAPSKLPIITQSYTSTVGMPAKTYTSKGSWQIYKVVPPNYSNANSNLVVYLRSWSGDWNAPIASPQSTTVQQSRIEFRAASLSEYQLVSDGPIQLELNAAINGHIHSNGFYDQNSDPYPNIDPKLRIWAIDKTFDCNGSFASVSTGTGGIDAKITAKTACGASANTNHFVNFQRVEASVDLFTKKAPNAALGDCKNSAAKAVVTCFEVDKAPAALDYTYKGSYGVSINATTGMMTVTKPGGPVLAPVSLAQSASSPGRVFVFDRTVRISAVTSANGAVLPPGRFTFIAWTPRTDITDFVTDDASIFLNSSIGAYPNPTTASGRRNSLGLIAQGNVTANIAPGTTCSVQRINAAVVAVTGKLTLPIDYITRMYDPKPMPQCSSTKPLIITGSVATRHSPTMYWYWGKASAPLNWAGYKVRKYRWDQNLIHTPPAGFPASDEWRISRMQTANEDCFPVAPSTVPKVDCV